METPYLDEEIEGLKNHIEHTESVSHAGIPETRKKLAEYEDIKAQNKELRDGLESLMSATLKHQKARENAWDVAYKLLNN